MSEGALVHFEWDPSKERDVRAMEGLFTRFRAQGKVFVNEKHEKLTAFDKNLGKMSLFPRPTTWDKIREEANP